MKNHKLLQILSFADRLIPAVRRCLVDPLPEVRKAAASTFEGLYQNIGPRALDDILTNLLNNLDLSGSEESEYALDGLRQVMVVKSKVVLPYLVPKVGLSCIDRGLQWTGELFCLKLGIVWNLLEICCNEKKHYKKWIFFS